jgi:hypothetical protein
MEGTTGNDRAVETMTGRISGPARSTLRVLRTFHHTRLVTLGLVTLMVGLVPITVAGVSTARPQQVPLVIDGKLNGDGIPVGWELEAFHNNHQIKLEPLRNGKFGIRLQSDGSSFGLHKTVDVDLNEFPILSWRWKVDRLPPAGDIREKSKDDQAAQVYVVFPNKLFQFRSPTIGYIWDSNAPAGTIADGHSAMTPIKVVVLRSGKQRLGEWIQESRNVAEDYQRLFGKDSLAKVGRVAIWINTQHTKSTAEATFTDLQFLRAK